MEDGAIRVLIQPMSSRKILGRIDILVVVLLQQLVSEPFRGFS